MLPTLSAEQVVDIFLAPGPAKAIEHRFGVKQSTVSNIKRRRTYAKVTAMFVPEIMNGLLIAFACVGHPGSN
jgi:hypothetical protein